MDALNSEQSEPASVAPEADGATRAAQKLGPLIELPAETQYRCPGERHPISRAIHLSRLAAFYPACRQCQHRHDTGQLPPQTLQRIQQVERRRDDGLFDAELQSPLVTDKHNDARQRLGRLL